MRLRIRYARSEDLVADYDAQLVRGGILVRVEPPADLSLGAPIDLEIVTPEVPIAVRANVLQSFPGAGIAVEFEPPSLLLDVVARARAILSPRDAPAAVHEIVADEAGGQRPVNERAEKLRRAQFGDRDDRAQALREQNPLLHAQVLRNPGLQLDEVLGIAKMRTVSPDVLKQVSERREWQRPDIALALVRNPKTPIPVAVRMLDVIGVAEVRALAKDPHVRAPIQQAARKKIFGERG